MEDFIENFYDDKLKIEQLPYFFIFAERVVLAAHNLESFPSMGDLNIKYNLSLKMTEFLAINVIKSTVEAEIRNRYGLGASAKAESLITHISYFPTLQRFVLYLKQYNPTFLE